MAANCDARCILVSGDPNQRLGRKACKRPGANPAILLGGDELYSIGVLAKSMDGECAGALLFTFRSACYITESGSRMRRGADRFRVGVGMNLYGGKKETPRPRRGIIDEYSCFGAGRNFAFGG